MDGAKKTVFILWDLSSNDVRLMLQSISRRPPEGFEISFPDPEKTGGALLDEVLLPGISLADRVLVVIPSSLSAITAISFELGICLGLNKPFALVRFGADEFEFDRIVRETLATDSYPTATYVRDLEAFRDLFSASDLWHQLAIEVPAKGSYEVALCPRSGEGDALLEELKASKPSWKRFDLEESGTMPEVLRAKSVIWIITPPSNPRTLRSNARIALAAGMYWTANPLQTVPSLRVLRSYYAPPIRSIQGLENTFEELADFAFLLRSREPGLRTDLLSVESLQIRNFKNISSLDLDFTPASSLSGDWTCIAGVNGAGKSSILQALSMVLLGERLVAELGSERIRRMLRRVGDQRLDAEITLVLRDGREKRTLYLPLSEQGLDRKKLFSHREHSQMRELWERLQKQLLVAYGATRNISDFKDTRHSSLSPHVQRLMTLFDPLTQIANIDLLLEGKTGSTPILGTLKRLLSRVLQGELAASTAPKPERLRFRQGSTDVEAIELPDGFRSTIAWLADLCAAWHQSASLEEISDPDPAKIRGIVLLDEIDLHLHPTLQRALVPRLREALPNVQFVVTTHSPLVLSSFDRAELIVLDRESEDGKREMDRQIFAFSTDQIYEWLMGTSPQSKVIEDKLSDGNDPNLPLYLYQSENQSEDQARATIEERERLLEELRGAKSR